MFHKIMFINKKTQFCLTRKKSNNLIHIHIFHKLLFFNFLVKSFLRKKNCSKLCGPWNHWAWKYKTGRRRWSERWLLLESLSFNQKTRVSLRVQHHDLTCFTGEIKPTTRQSHVLVTTGARVDHYHFPQRLAGEFSPSPRSIDLDLTESAEAHSLTDRREEGKKINKIFKSERHCNLFF